MSTVSNSAKKALVIFAIEKALLEMGEPVYEQVSTMLSKNYHSDISDCYEHPEYLSTILKHIFGKSYVGIVESIRKELDEFAYQEQISAFIAKISA